MNDEISGLDFSVLLKRVLDRWPESIDVTQLKIYGDRLDLHAVGGLGNLGDAIVDMLDSEIDAVLVTTLCDSVTSTIRSAAQFCTVIKPAMLRASTVRDIFEKRLNQAATNPALGWGDDDILLIKLYFSANAQ